MIKRKKKDIDEAGNPSRGGEVKIRATSKQTRFFSTTSCVLVSVCVCVIRVLIVLPLLLLVSHEIMKHSSPAFFHDAIVHAFIRLTLVPSVSPSTCPTFLSSVFYQYAAPFASSALSLILCLPPSPFLPSTKEQKNESGDAPQMDFLHVIKVTLAQLHWEFFFVQLFFSK